MSSTKESQLRKYLAKINPVIERLVIDLLVDQPSDFVTYSVEWFQSKGERLANGEVLPPSTREIKTNIQVEQRENDEAEVVVVRPHAIPKEEDSEEEEGDDEFDESQLAAASKKKKDSQFRTSVSAEVYGSFNKKSAYVPKVVPKEEEQKQRIEKRLMQAFMFSALDEKERGIVVGSMEEVKFAVGDWIIKQGADGDNLYVVDSGELDCFKSFSKGAENTYLKTYKPGEAFGELALLYNAPRAASIQAKTDSVLFSLDRECFNHIVKDSAGKKRERYEETLKKVELLSSMDPYERMQLCDGLKDIKFNAGEYIIREEEEGNNFYMIEEGELIATKGEGENEKVVFEYKEGDYFGELALIKNIPRQANVKAVTDVKLMYLDHDTFKRLLGPIESILSRNEERYAKYNPENIHLV